MSDGAVLGLRERLLDMVDAHYVPGVDIAPTVLRARAMALTAARMALEEVKRSSYDAADPDYARWWCDYKLPELFDTLK